MKKDMHNKKGYALVVVLCAVMLCALMVIILMERGTRSLKSASAYSQGLQVRALSDMVQNVVQAQIHDATTLNQTTDTALNQRDTWASQPGALRVFTPTGELREIFKLYSAENLTTTDPDLAKDVDDEWFNKPAQYTDLNEPVNDGTNTYYPILNPDAATLNTGATGIANGFSVTDAPVESGAGANDAPMPVRWIYVLRDGTLCQLGDSRIDGVANPIVGRIAFWVDDETAKVNINTASPVTANSYWDVPRANSSWEMNNLAWMQPAQNEYQRYPGHPAMVSLRSILGNLGGLSAANYYAFTPRYYWGGSEDGTKGVNATNRIPLLTLKEDRTYATVDELLFRSHPEGGTTERAQPTPQQVDSLRFFLSASSRAPELNLFGQPRVSIWPIHRENTPTRRTPYDQLIAFCSTIGGKEYYFAREEPLSPTHDYTDIARNQILYGYLQRLTSVPVPGFPGSGTFASKYLVDRDQILTEIFDYIRITNLNEVYQEVGGNKIAGFLSYTPNWNLNAFGDSRDEMLINTTASYPPDGPLRGAGLVVPIEIGNTRGMGRFPAIAEVGLMFVTHAEKKPTAPPPPAIPVPQAPHPETPGQFQANPAQLEALLVIETITPAFGFMPWVGKDIYFELVSSDLEFGEIDSAGTKLPGVSAMFSPGTGGAIYYPPVLSSGFSPGGYDGPSWILGADASIKSGNASYYAGPYQSQFFSPPLNLEMEPLPSDPQNPTASPAYKLKNTHFYVKGGTIRINIKVGDIVVQSYTFHFDDIDQVPIPTLNTTDQNAANYYASGIPYGRAWWRTRFWTGERQGPFSGDVLHSVELVHGDARLVAGNKNVPAALFVPHENYGKNQHFAHGLRESSSSGKSRLWMGASAGTYVDLPLAGEEETITGNGNTYTFWHGNQPKISSRITSLLDKGWSGDFDNGISAYSDGPFINKPDEGMQDTGSTPYYGWQWELANGLFSPLRQVPSAAMFGSLPTGVKEGQPWRTLLFNPNPAAGSTPVASTHKGFEDPKDYLLLDLFRMPVVEPYAISGPASTDGKINMNYAIAPFSYIRRASAWYALLEPLKLFAIPDNDSKKYKGGAMDATNYRHPIHIQETLRQFEDRFSSNDIFHSATEICSLFLVPEGSTLSSVAAFWSTHRLTGDNSREKPYTELYAKLTTQSNTYRIHMRVQILPPSKDVPSGKKDFEPLAEYRGSRLIERYLDTSASHFDGVDPDTTCLNALYQYRVLETRQFNP